MWKTKSLKDNEPDKTIPSRVFFNHFYAINFRISSDENRYNLNNLEFFINLNHQNPNEGIDYNKIRRILWNSWSTEYALKTTQLTNNEDYYRFSLHWSFPQAYYSTYLSMSAFHHTQNKANNIHEKSIKIFGNDIKNGIYPHAINFYASGLYKSFEYNNLPNFNNFPDSWSGLTNINNLEEAERQIALFLKTTRKLNAQDKKEKYQSKNHKSFRNKLNKPLKRYRETHWNLIYNHLHYTSIMNLLYRLRIKANYHDIDSFLNADINFRQFHELLTGIINYLNFVHEAFIAKKIGSENYHEIINDFPEHMFDENAETRFNNKIRPLLE